MARRFVRGLVSPVIVLAFAASAAAMERISNGEDPANGVQTLVLEELWRVGGDDDDGPAFGQVVRVRADDVNNVYVLDAQLQQVFVFDDRGEMVRELFGEGEGPGEVRRARDVVLLPSGEVGAVCQFPAAIVMVDETGEEQQSIRATIPGQGYTAAVARGGSFVVAATVRTPGEVDGTSTLKSLLGSIDRDGNVLAEFIATERFVDYQRNYTFNEREAMPEFMFAFDVGPDGKVYAMAESDEYAISVFSPDGELQRVIRREFTVPPRSTAERERIEALTERRFRSFPFRITINIAENAAVSPWFFRGVQVAEDGSVWVRTSRSDEAGRAMGALTVFDVFDPAGHFDRQVAIPLEGRATTTGIFMVSEDRLVVVRGFVDAMSSAFGGGAGGSDDEGAEPEPVEVVCYRINRD